MDELIKNIWNFIDINAGKISLILSIILIVAGFIKYKRDRKDKDLEVMPEFEVKSIAYSENGRKIRLINKTKNMVKVLKIISKSQVLIGDTTTLNWYLDENENNFFIQIRTRTGNLKLKIIFENKLRRKYVQEITITKRPNDVTDKFSISPAKRY